MQRKSTNKVIEERALGMTRYMISLPGAKRTLAYLLSATMFAGICLRMLYTPGASLADALVYGGSEGVLLIGMPALLAAALATSVLARKRFRQVLKYFMFISLAGAVLAALSYGAGLLLSTAFGLPQWAFVLVGNALVFILWVASGTIPLNFGRKSVPVALVHPTLNLTFLVIWSAYGMLEAGSVPLILLRFLVASGVLLLALWSLFYVINAPAKRNFGINAIQAAALFFAQATQGSQDLEGVLEGMGETIRTYVGAISFRKRGGGKLKAALIVPYVHYGPFGNLGGSEFPALLGQRLSKKFGCPVAALHATAYHDFNPVHASSIEPIAKLYEKELARGDGYSADAAFVGARSGTGDVFGVATGGGALLTLSRAPEFTEDVEFSAGLALMNLARSRGFGEALVADRHNCYRTSKTTIYAGSREFFEYHDAVSLLEQPKRSGGLKLGVAHDPLREFTPAQGIGRAGMHAFVFETAGRRACIIVFDANNCLPRFRESLLEALRRYRFHFCDLMTTDTHSVNNINGVANPLGAQAGWEALIPHAVKAVQRALEDIEPVEARTFMERTEVRVLGSGRAGELLSTLSAIVSIAKIAAPVVLIAAVALAFISIMFLARVVKIG